MQGIITYFKNLNPWQICFIVSLAVYLGSWFFSIRGKQKAFAKDYKDIKEMVLKLHNDHVVEEAATAITSGICDGLTRAVSGSLSKSDKT